MIIRHYIPHKILCIADVIWEQRSDTPSRWKILPSGKVELIFRIGSPDHLRMLWAKKIGESDSPLSHFCFLSGLHTRPLELAYDRFHVMGIQLKPIAVKALFGLPLFGIRDYYVEGEAMLKDLRQIEDTLNSSEPFLDKAQWLENFIFSRIKESADLHIAISLHQVVAAIAMPDHNSRNRTVQDLLGYSRTHTFRIFNEWFGLSAHSYQRLVQFVHAVQYLHHSPANLTAAGLASGYFDQAHFIRSFKEFSGMTPGAYGRLKSYIPGQLPF
jgi:AraC-like DNA-binding protein